MYNNNNNKVGAVIVSYNGGKKLIDEIESLVEQVAHIYIIDNASNKENLLILNNINNKVKVVYNKENLGIGKALNIGIELCLKDKCNWILTMDQDSIAEKGMVDKLLVSAIEMESEGVMSFAPLIIYEGEESKKQKRSLVTYKETVITSGNLLNAKIFNDKSMYFNESLFIDNVDFDFCLRLKNNGYKIVQINGAILKHELGELKHVKIGKFDIKYHSHPPYRKYYMARNDLFMIKKYIFTNPKFVLKKIIYSLIFVFKNIIFEDNRINNFKYIYLGILDAMKSKYGKMNF